MNIRQLIGGFVLVFSAMAGAQEIPGQSEGVWREGDFVWFDLVTDDANAAKTFYARMFGWEFSRGDDYSVIRSDGEYLGSIAYDGELDPAVQDARWISSISVPDVDSAVASVTAGGGSVLVAAEDLKGRGRFAVVSDPQGAIFAVLKTTAGDPLPSRIITGDLLWMQLWTPDADASGAFYEKALGYGRRADFLQYFEANKALLVEFSWEDVEAHWLPVVLVPDVKEATARVRTLGGLVHLDVASNFAAGKMSLVADPTGGAFLMQETGE